MVPSLELKIPPLLLLVLCLLLQYALSTYVSPFLTSESNPAWQTNFSHLFAVRVGLMTVVMIFGLFIAWLGVRAFHQSKTTVNPLNPSEASSLVSNGIFAYTRNPMYVGMSVVAFGFSLFLLDPFAFLFVPLFVMYLNHFQIIPEERELRKIFGKEFEEYMLRVRRWI
ncbi:hypothetical protein C9374_002229 [Naegleria lovaniensis]|uniref:Protein-S-isoprenylcysteine O-methyltransferase n=1 Tax=Naegleria lovaniensis TaxID=51637 RepID=A0AA88KK76_NAELO|nr:uncharacterized protein C9374_002229 [Naegleria lovaniensis]KAG2386485.1 hypothetical protein C9374_002229 [Naegleria lovaniensis]